MESEAGTSSKMEITLIESPTAAKETENKRSKKEPFREGLTSATHQPSLRNERRFVELGNQAKDITTLKVLVIGDPGVGKTAFINYYVGGRFYENYRQTIGVDFFHKMIRLRGGQLVRLQLWDIAGQERQRRLFRVYYRDANGCLLLFDLSNPQTLAHVQEWKEELDRHCTLPNGSTIPCLLLGNKADLVHEAYANEVEKLVNRQSFIGFRHVSAKEGTNISDSIEYLTEVMMSKWQPLKSLPNLGVALGAAEVDPERRKSQNSLEVPIYERSCC